jgi:hypothetical protein
MDSSMNGTSGAGLMFERANTPTARSNAEVESA